VRQPRGKLAQTAAWLSIITAEMYHQNWYVYNHIVFEVIVYTTVILN